MLNEWQAAQLFDLQEKNGVFETLIEQCYSSVLGQGDRAIDGGAHIGMHTLPMARRVGTGGRVFSFEPIGSLADCIEKAAEDMPQVRVFRQALSDRDGDTSFHVMTDEPWLSGIARRFKGTDKPVEIVTVPRFRLDLLLEEPIRFIKLDLESGEYHALRGGMQLLIKHRPIIALECGRADSAIAAGYTEDEYFGLFEQVGYRLHDLFGRPFLRSDFYRPYTDRMIPHYLVATAANHDNVIEHLLANAQAALNDG
ncbi:FkbM family methyltransferase [Paraburkholderia sacchari]|uniref:FkbM family methyltransferase n=1 Tax=Paraburkholderia sacchari TaxID=159450 RepID=A0A8T6ZA11_9BURK|nr:FkbM family methyltransferase [Paraburkholderia sacchari]NLP61666.1 FkbM family methyltransferase [Paraburkholderia sacchari]